MKNVKSLEDLERSDPVFVRKRYYLIIACFIRMFLTGVEYSVILPSVWLYLRKFEVGSWYLGIVGASYSCATMISLPIAGRIYDRTKRAKEVIIVMNTFEIIGNIIYALHFSVSLPLFGRIIAGIGDGFYVIIFSEIPALVRRQHITRMFAVLELGSILGIVLGPSLNLFLEKIDFWIGKWHINFATSPGLFMAMMWMIMQVLTIFMINNMYLEYRDVHEDRSSTQQGEKQSEAETSESEAEAWDQTKPLVSNNHENNESSYVRRQSGIFSLTSLSWRESFRELCTLEVAVIIFTDCVLWLSQIEFEILAPLIGEEDMKFSEAYLSYFYIFGGIQLLIVFLVLWSLSGKVYDVHYIICSGVMTTVALILMVIYQIERRHFTAKLAIACIISFLVFSSIPLNLVAGRAALIKITKESNQGFVLGMYSAICRVALILGPILGSNSFPNLAPLGSIMAIFCLSALTGVILCRERIISRQQHKERLLLFST